MKTRSRSIDIILESRSQFGKFVLTIEIAQNILNYVKRTSLLWNSNTVENLLILMFDKKFFSFIATKC